MDLIPVLVSGILSIIYLNYFYIKYSEFLFVTSEKVELILLNVSTILLIVSLLLVSRHFNLLLSRSWNNEKLAEAAKQQTDQLMLKLETSTEKMLTQIAYTDDVTQLPNEHAYQGRIKQLVLQTNKEYIIGLFYINIVNLQIINTTLGNTMGDSVLQMTSKRLNKHLRHTSYLGRGSGNCFLVLFCEENRKACKDTAAKIIQLFDQPLQIDGNELYIRINIGISLYPDHTENEEKLLTYAELAATKFDRIDQSRYHFYKPSFSTQVEKSLFYFNHLQKAFSHNQLSVYYQPQYDIYDRKVIGCEALVRWEHPELGFISPDEFIPIAEDTGLIDHLGAWVIERVCTDLSRWTDQNGPIVPVSVNISRKQLYQNNFVENFIHTLKRFEIDPTYIQAEITESAANHNNKQFNSILQALNDYGIAISIDDFGTGFSSLSNLSMMPVQTLKLDQSFVRRLGVDPKNDKIVITIINLAKRLELNVIGEGVETNFQLQTLRSYRCKQIQGYLIAKPLPLEDFKQFMLKNQI